MIFTYDVDQDKYNFILNRPALTKLPCVICGHKANILTGILLTHRPIHIINSWHNLRWPLKFLDSVVILKLNTILIVWSCKADLECNICIGYWKITILVYLDKMKNYLNPLKRNFTNAVFLKLVSKSEAFTKKGSESRIVLYEQLFSGHNSKNNCKNTIKRRKWLSLVVFHS